MSILPTHSPVGAMGRTEWQKGASMNVAKIWIYSEIGAMQHPFSLLGAESRKQPVPETVALCADRAAAAMGQEKQLGT